ncbi:MAG: tetratricopeptide (TPR) repeat protein [Candidatus Azotimanducaceae bacterium]|jgi:tetratricopeptide (TPR) repeat protein
MTDNRVHKFQKLLEQLFAAVNRGDPTALNKILALLKKIPEEPNLLNLAGMASINQGNPLAGIDYLLRSLARQPVQPEVNNDLANIYAAQGQFEAAEQYYRQALHLQPAFADAWKNLGLLLANTRPIEAQAALQRAITLNPQDASALTALGNSYKDLEDFEKAKACYERALEINPAYVNALHNLGLCYKLVDQLAPAIAYYQRALALAPDNAEIHYNYGNALFEMGQANQAEAQYLQSLEKNPRFVLAHETLSEFYWQAGEPDKVELSYQRAISAAPRDIHLHLSYINLLIAVGRDESAQEQLSQALKIDTTAALMHAQGRLAANRLDYADARIALTRSLALTFDLEVAHDLSRLHIRQGDYDVAQQLIDRILAFAPENQLSWALQSLCWRLVKDERYQWLNDYQTHIRAFTIPTPTGYSTLTEFMAELEKVLLGMHQAQSAPTRQTLKGGTQTPGRLLHKPHPVIASYKASLTTVVKDYISSLPRDDLHPFLKRRPTQVDNHFKFSGSWSAKLSPEGFHVNHVHPAGWVSSACYISLPDVMSTADDATKAGCIKFGESALALDDREVVERIIRPQVGQLVLFPSFTWHGTYAFDGDPSAYRLTAPFDVIPVETGQ